MQRKSSDHFEPSDGEAQAPKPKRRRTTKAVVLAEPAAPSGLPALFERAAGASNFDVDALTKLMALKREIEADAERRTFDQDFAALQAELSRVEANVYDPQKRRSYADINALVDVVGPLAAAKGFIITYDAEPSAVAGCVKVTMKLVRNGIERTASVDVPMDGAGMRGGANMSAPQAYGSTITYGRKLALTLLFNLTVSAPQKATEPPPVAAPRLFPERQREEPPPWDDADHMAVLKRAAERSDDPPSDAQVKYLADLMALDRHSARLAIQARVGDRS